MRPTKASAKRTAGNRRGRALWSCSLRIGSASLGEVDQVPPRSSSSRLGWCASRRVYAFRRIRLGMVHLSVEERHEPRVVALERLAEASVEATGGWRGS